MKYNNNDAIGLLETTGMVPAISATDVMLKAADVQLVAYENIGSTLVTVIVKGNLDAVKIAIESGKIAASAIGCLTASNIMPRPVKQINDIASIYGLDETYDEHELSYSLGFIETFGIIYALEAADAMAKSSNVELVGFENVASGYISILVKGDVAACQAAVEAGIAAVEAMDASVYSSLVLPMPHPVLIKITKQYYLEEILPR